MKFSPSSILNGFKLVGYILLLAIDEAITVLSMLSVGNSDAEKIGLASFGFIIVLLGAWVFLSGIRCKGPERIAKLAAWAVSVALIVSINWAYTRTMIRTQTSTVQSTQTETDLDKQLRAARIASYQKQIETLMLKLDKVSIWRENERAAIQVDIDDANAKIDELSRKPEIKQTEQQVQSMDVFEKMSQPVGGNRELVSDLWWILVFLVAQLFTVLAAPKRDDDAPPPRTRKPRKPVDLTDWVHHWVDAHWMGARVKPDQRPYKMLSWTTFDRYIRDHWRAFPESRHKQILQAATRAGVIALDEILVSDQTEAERRIIEQIERPVKEDYQGDLFGNGG